MGTIVTYNGNQSDPVKRNTAYLPTAGKYMTGDITITDTGMDADDCVYQDKDGFIILNDSYGTYIDRKTLEITTNGTYVAPQREVWDRLDVKIPGNDFFKSVVDRSVTEIKASDLGGTTNIPQSIFRNSEALITADLSNIDTIGMYAFYGCTALENIICPKLTSIGSHAFDACGNLGTINMPLWTGSSATYNWIFGYAGKATKTIIVLPSLINFGTCMFSRGHFKIVDIGKNSGAMGADTFYHNTGDTTVETLILRREDDIVAAGTADAINGVRTVYVPNNLISSYQTATNWSTRYDSGIITFLPIEGSQYENYYADGTPIT